MGKWQNLTAQQKAQVIKFSIQNGVFNIKDIRDTFNIYANGGKLNHKKSGEEQGESQELTGSYYVLPEVTVEPKWYDREWAKRTAAGMSAVGAGLSFVPHKYAKLAGTALQIPDLFYDIRSLLVDPNTGNTVEVGLDLLKNKQFQQKVFSGLKGDKYKVRNLPLAIPGIINDATYAITGKSISDLNKKSTGGPLYPFSFEKNPYFKTPVVRYDEGGELNNWEQGALARANRVYSNYEQAIDNKIHLWRIPLQRQLKNWGLPSGLSNCTLSATQWVDPSNPIMKAATIFSNPSTGYTKISSQDAVPGNLLITKNPNTGSYHTMMIEGFDVNGKPILRYSTGNHTQDALKTNVSLSDYHKRDNSYGGNHTEDHYFRYNYPNEVFLPEITVFPHKYDFGGWLQSRIQNIVAKTNAVDNLRKLNASLSKGVNTITDLFKSDEQNVQDAVAPVLNTELPINFQDVTSINSNITEQLRVLDQLQQIQEENKALEALRQDMGHMQVLDRDDKTYFREKVKELEEKRINWKELSKQQIKEKQRELAEAGFYDNNISYKKDKEKVKELQRMLVKKGFLDNSNGKAIDGIVGKNTQSAYNEYIINKESDGIVGKRTLAAADKYYKSLTKGVTLQQNVNAHDTEWCAEWVNKTVNIGTSGRAQDFGVTGNAWNMFKNILDAGGEVLYNAYDMMGSKPVNAKDLKTKTENIIGNKNTRFNAYSSLQIGDIIGLYMPSSDWHETTLKTGSTYNTHVGVVTGFSADGMPIIEDNIHKTKRSLRADDPRLRITVVGRPAYTGNIQEITPKNKTSQYEISGENEGFQYNNESSRKYADSIASVADSIGEIYTKANMDEVQKIALGILGKETQFGMDTSANSLSTRIKHNISKYIQPEEDVSSEFVRFKLGGLNGQQRDYLGIHSLEDLNDPEKAGRAVALILARNYDYFERLSEEYPKLGITKEDIRNLTILSYNQGMGKLYHIGFDGNGDYAPQELEMIRALANYGTQDGHEGYIKGVNRIIQNRISMKK